MAVRILYYVDGPWPSPEQYAEAKAIGAFVRNGRLVSRPERCDYVAGAVPACCSHLPVFGAEPPPEPAPSPADDQPPVDEEQPPPRRPKKRRKHPSPEVEHGPDD